MMATENPIWNQNLLNPWSKMDVMLVWMLERWQNVGPSSEF
jgi:hypothetical protein